MEITPMRLPFKIPEFAPRTTWVSAVAREVWEPRLHAIAQRQDEAERAAVAEGLRPSALQYVMPEALPDLMHACAKDRLTVLPLGREPLPGTYRSQGHDLRPGEPFAYRCAITSPTLAAEWASAWTPRNDARIGTLLGYPGCCRDFFTRVWSVERWFDTTWPMADPGGDVRGAVNVLWRWHGVRAVSHLPCSFACEASLALQTQMLALWHRRWPDEGRWLAEILSWPVEWTALHGLAELRTPITRTVVPTDATATRLVVNFRGPGYPVEGAAGARFPHRTTRQATPLRVVARSNPHHNGFASLAAMQAAHAPLLSRAGGPYETIVDLGCGDGTLASKIPAKRRVGIEADPARAAAARTRLDHVEEVDCTSDAARMLLAREQPDLVIAQVVRNPPETLRDYRVLSYSYDEPFVRLEEPHGSDLHAQRSARPDRGQILPR
jgi:hypothetical protein